MAQVLARGAILYLSTINVGSAALFGYDKFQASRGEWRVPERTLCKSAILGGWAGGLVAMQVFRHKTRKKSFQEKYVGAIGQNFAGMGMVLFIATRSAHIRMAFSRELGNTGRSIGRMFGGRR